jgi:hypothetical protein
MKEPLEPFHKDVVAFRQKNTGRPNEGFSSSSGKALFVFTPSMEF